MDTSTLLMLQAEAKEKARLIRNCPYCAEGWRDTENNTVTRCVCYRAWKTAIFDLREAVKEAKKDIASWETDSMFDHHTVSGLARKRDVYPRASEPRSEAW